MPLLPPRPAIARTRSGSAHNCGLMRGWLGRFHCRDTLAARCPGETLPDNATRRITEFNEAGPPLRDVVFRRRDSVSDSKRSLRGAICDEPRGEALRFPPYGQRGTSPSLYELAEYALSVDKMLFPFGRFAYHARK